MRHVRVSCERRSAPGVPRQKGRILSREEPDTDLAEEPLDEAALRQVIDDTGYTVRSVKSEPYEKRGLFASWSK